MDMGSYFQLWIWVVTVGNAYGKLLSLMDMGSYFH